MRACILEEGYMGGGGAAVESLEVAHCEGRCDSRTRSTFRVSRERPGKVAMEERREVGMGRIERSRIDGRVQWDRCIWKWAEFC